MKGFAKIVFKPGMCSDDGRALTGWWDVYTAKTLNQHFWTEPRLFKTEEEAKAWCITNDLTIAGVSWC